MLTETEMNRLLSSKSAVLEKLREYERTLRDLHDSLGQSHKIISTDGRRIRELEAALTKISNQPEKMGYVTAHSASRLHQECWDIANKALRSDAEILLGRKWVSP